MGDNGKENGNYYNGESNGKENGKQNGNWDYIGVMFRKLALHQGGSRMDQGRISHGGMSDDTLNPKP